MIDSITPNIAISNCLEARDIGQLKAAAIRSILCLDGCLVGVAPSKLEVEAIEVAKLDDGPETDLHMLERAVGFLDRLLRDKAPVLVHCHAGRSRSPVVVAGHLMASKSIDADTALAEIGKHHEINIAPDLLLLLRRLEVR